MLERRSHVRTEADRLPEEEALDTLEKLMRIHHGTHVPNGLSAIISSCLIMAWGSFEILAGDLWEAAVGLCPSLKEFRGIGGRIALLAANKPEGYRATIEKQNRQATPQTPPKPAIRGVRPYSFGSVSSIREAYSKTFDVRSADIDSILADGRLESLESVRHILVHKAGIADDKYEKTATRLGEIAIALNSGDSFPIDGKIACELIEPVVRSGQSLIHAVDNWIDGQ